MFPGPLPGGSPEGVPVDEGVGTKEAASGFSVAQAWYSDDVSGRAAAGGWPSALTLAACRVVSEVAPKVLVSSQLPSKQVTISN